MNADPQLSAALHHWGARAVPFHDQPEQVPFLTPTWQEALRLLNQTAALRSVMLLSGDNGVGKSALAAYWLKQLEPKLYLPLVITQATLSATGLLAVLLHKLGQSTSLHRSHNLTAMEKALRELGRLTPVQHGLCAARKPNPSSDVRSHERRFRPINHLMFTGRPAWRSLTGHKGCFDP